MEEILGSALLTSTAFQCEKQKYLIVVSNLYKAQKMYEYVASFLSKEEVLLFPNDELIRAETLAQSKEMMATRLFVLDRILKGQAKIVIANVSSLTKFLPSPTLFQKKTLDFVISQKLNLKELKEKLIKSGYTQVNKIDQSLQFASRGDILDIYSVNNDYPIRIEFFDDQIESIRYFDIATQSSIKKIEKATILPAHDFILSDEELLTAENRILDIVEKSQNALPLNLFEKLRDLSLMDIDNIKDNNYSPRLYRYYSLLQNNHYSLLDYCKNYQRVFVDQKSLLSSNKLLLEESWSFLEELFSEGKMISQLSLYQDISPFIAIKKQAIFLNPFVESNNDITFKVKHVPFVANKEIDALNILHSYINDGYHIIITLPIKEQLNLMIELLHKEGLPFEMVEAFSLPKKSSMGISLINLPDGMVLEDEKIVYLTSKELFNSKNKTVKFESKFKEATILKDYQDLSPGDYVVHEYQGIGQFIELQTIESEGTHRDYLKIAYSGDEFLYVPLNQFQLVRKYQGKEGASPRLSHLHSQDWQKTKEKIKARIDDLANRLFNLYKERSHIKGFAFQKDDEMQKQFDDSFEYELTKDQSHALKEIKADMEKDTPMDRLLCGDVGFGKTEVAFSAIFKAISSGKQAMLLCPTTLLARQHYELAMKRFQSFDIKIAIFSRLISEKKQKEYIKGIKDGAIHIAIGTHRLLSKDIVFKDLGLLVIDEEQRFGVEQKEKIKELKTNLDVLTLSATPIPRTLQISLLGVRSLSQINTAPKDRMPIQTYVVPFDRKVVVELIERELGRTGQVYYLHNDVATIYTAASLLAKAIPSARIAVAHGQMNKEEIEDTMLHFYNGDIDVLVCTTIIENGIDIPNANLLIVENSVNYGLSQLYQIKGRVGRGDRIAYAYLMYNGNKPLNEKASKRLKALQDFTELGSGYKIAQRDLMIRGAGDILGPEQAGFIDSIGLDMYIKLLNEAVNEKITGIKQHEEIKSNSSLKIDAYVPEEFANDSDKIELYQEIMAASSSESLLTLKNKTRDLFGALPSSVELLFTKCNIDILAKEADISSIQERKDRVELILGERYIQIKGIGNLLFEAMIPYLSTVKISYVNHAFKIDLYKQNNWLNNLEAIIKTLRNVLPTEVK